MADEQYEWLDKGAAERLLRGEPVDPVGGHSCTDAERLVAALEAAARSARPATGELPGEAAALAAFRTATRSARARTRANARTRGVVEQAGGPAGVEVLEPVRIGAVSVPHAPAPSAGAGRGRSARWSRPVRFGLVASLAGCALGGVAVAAGAGMLPGPFGEHAPVPATSVSAAATPEELGSGLTEEENPQPPPSATTGPGTSSPPPAPPPRPGTRTPAARAGRRSTAATDGSPAAPRAVRRTAPGTAICPENPVSPAPVSGTPRRSRRAAPTATASWMTRVDAGSKRSRRVPATWTGSATG